MKGYDEIVAAKIGDIITRSPKHIIAAIEMNQPMEFIRRAHMEFMAALDLGPRWREFLEAAILKAAQVLK